MSCQVPGRQRVVERGGGHGEYALEFRRRGLAVTMQDRPQVIAVTGDRLRAEGVEPFPGDFFEILPAGPFDLVFCACVNHTYDQAGNRHLCHRAASVTRPGGVLAIVTYLRGPRRHGPDLRRADAHGRQRGRHPCHCGFRQWLADAGYGDVA